MRVSPLVRLYVFLAALLAGCTQNPYLLQTQNQTLQSQQLALQQRNRELESRASTLDQDNQELQTMLAQTRQEGKLLQDQLVAVRDQLSGATSQLAQLREDKQLTEQQAEALVANARRRSGAIITANSSLRRSLPTINVPGVEVRADGDLVRVELAASRLFAAGGQSLQPSAGMLIDSVASEIAHAYPDRIVGVEGHTDSDPLRGGAVGDQQLSVARAMAVYQQVVARRSLAASQLFVVGHGGNHPVVSNATGSGKARNNRVELVVYPDKVSARQ